MHETSTSGYFSRYLKRNSKMLYWIDQIPISSYRWLQWQQIHFYRVDLNLLLNLHKYRRNLNLQQYAELWIGHIHIGIYEYLTGPSRSYYCKNESTVIVISGNWE